jgi:probable phosphoglycerate mutase
MEWDYGEYEGLSTPQIREERPDWQLWRDGVPGGETVEQVGARADRVIARAALAGGDVALFAHGHLLRILAARWLGLPADCGRMFALATATLSVLGHERETPVVSRWNVG